MNDLEPEESIPKLKVGEMDLVLTYEFENLPEPRDPGVERHLLITEPIFVAISKDHPLAKGPIRVADLANEQWVVGRDGSPFLDVMVRVANEAGFEPQVDLHSNDYQVILAAVQAGLGAALVPPLAFFAEYPGVVHHSPIDIEVRRRVVAVTRSGSAGSPVISAALAALREAAAHRAEADPRIVAEG
jgi:DNA-binding transcriptional LysR family regulator